MTLSKILLLLVFFTQNTYAKEFLLKSCTPPTNNQLRVLTFNILMNPNRERFEHLVKVIQGVSPDIIGLQESESVLSQLGKRLQMYVNTNRQILSRYPIEELSQNKENAVLIHIKKFSLYFANFHLKPYPYGPYDLRDGAEVEDVISQEQSNHLPPIKNLITNLPIDHPIILTGDFNTPSHLDWTQERKHEHFNYAVSWPVSSYLENNYFIDSFRKIYPNSFSQKGHTWTPHLSNNEVYDRIDYVYYKPNRTNLKATCVHILGENPQQAHIVFNPWPSDHRAILTYFSI